MSWRCKEGPCWAGWGAHGLGACERHPDGGGADHRCSVPFPGGLFICLLSPEGRRPWPVGRGVPGPPMNGEEGGLAALTPGPPPSALLLPGAG